VKFLLNENIAPSLCERLHSLGYSARHVKDVNLLSAKDEDIFSFAQKSGEIIVTHDLDYSRIHAISGAEKPSVILLRLEPVNTDIIYGFLKDHLEQIKLDLLQGSFIVVEQDQMRIRKLPIKKA
jgi:predicted nuclease of predicted toxin-antitoxin system